MTPKKIVVKRIMTGIKTDDEYEKELNKLSFYERHLVNLFILSGSIFLFITSSLIKRSKAVKEYEESSKIKTPIEKSEEDKKDEDDKEEEDKK